MADAELRRMLTWVLAVFVATVVFAVIVVELTIRWFR
jgi:hypothetical protein